jgi:hypothetical protein
MKTSSQPLPATMPARIHLRVKHPKLDPKEITRILSMTPEHTLEAGRHASSLAAESYWIAPLTFSRMEEPWLGFGEDELGEPARLASSTLQVMGDESVVGLALRRLQAHQSFFHAIADEGGTATLLIDVNSSGSMTIPPALARKLADLGLGLELDWGDTLE